MNCQLQKCFLAIQQNVDAICLASKDSKGVLSSLVNTAEQLECCQKVRIQETALSDFEDLQEILSFKLTQTLEEKISVLQKACSQIENSVKLIHRQKEGVMTHYRNHSDELSIATCVKTGHMWPSICQMMIWIEEIYMKAFWLSCEKKTLLGNVNFLELESVEKLSKSWLDDHDLKSKTNDILLNLQYFMEEQF